MAHWGGSHMLIISIPILSDSASVIIMHHFPIMHFIRRVAELCISYIVWQSLVTNWKGEEYPLWIGTPISPWSQAKHQLCHDNVSDSFNGQRAALSKQLKFVWTIPSLWVGGWADNQFGFLLNRCSGVTTRACHVHGNRVAGREKVKLIYQFLFAMWSLRRGNIKRDKLIRLLYLFSSTDSLMNKLVIQALLKMRYEIL